MKAERIKGQPGKSKRERIEALGWLTWQADDDDEVPEIDVLPRNEVLAILDAPEEEPQPDRIFVDLTVDEWRELFKSHFRTQPSGFYHPACDIYTEFVRVMQEALDA